MAAAVRMVTGTIKAAIFLDTTLITLGISPGLVVMEIVVAALEVEYTLHWPVSTYSVAIEKNSSRLSSPYLTSAVSRPWITWINVFPEFAEEFTRLSSSAAQRVLYADNRRTLNENQTAKQQGHCHQERGSFPILNRVNEENRENPGC